MIESAADYLAAGGSLMIPLSLLSLAIWYWTLALWLRSSRAVRGARAIDELLPRLGAEASRMREHVSRWSRIYPGPCARVLRHAVGGELEPEDVRDRLAEARAGELPPFFREVKLLKGMVAAAPLLGLLGTVSGMMATFTALATDAGERMEMLSSGISEALVTTQVGLVIALPGLFGAHIVGGLLREIEVAIDRAGKRLRLRGELA